MLDNDPSDLAGGFATRRQLMYIAGAAALTAPLAALLADGGGGQPSQGAQPASAARAIRRAILVPRFGADASADWYPSARSRLDDLGIEPRVVALRPAPAAPRIDETVAAIAEAVGDDADEIGGTILIGHSVGSRALLVYLSRRSPGRTFAGLVSVAGWSTVDDLRAYAALQPWVDVALDFASIKAAAGPIDVHLSDDDPFTRDWRANAAEWLGELGATVHIAHGAGHFMTKSPGPVLDTILLAATTR
jgi:uncharacterized protein